MDNTEKLDNTIGISNFAQNYFLFFFGWNLLQIFFSPICLNFCTIFTILAELFHIFYPIFLSIISHFYLLLLNFAEFLLIFVNFADFYSKINFSATWQFWKFSVKKITKKNEKNFQYTKKVHPSGPFFRASFFLCLFIIIFWKKTAQTDFCVLDFFFSFFFP